MERETKHQVVMELLQELRKEMEEIDEQRDELKEKHDIAIEVHKQYEISKEMKHLNLIENKLLHTTNWLTSKMIKLEEEA